MLEFKLEMSLGWLLLSCSDNVAHDRCDIKWQIEGLPELNLTRYNYCTAYHASYNLNTDHVPQQSCNRLNCSHLESLVQNTWNRIRSIIMTEQLTKSTVLWGSLTVSYQYNKDNLLENRTSEKLTIQKSDLNTRPVLIAEHNTFKICYN